jgi:hypothetical protein
MLNIPKWDIDRLQRECEKIHYFGLGFIQLKLNREERLHFYNKDLAKIATVQCEDIHNHRYPFSSTVIRGDLTNVIVDVKHDPEGKFRMRNVSCNEYGVPESDKICIPVSREVINTAKMHAGSTYIMEANTFHYVYSDFGITYFKRELNGPYPKAYAQVVTHKDIDPVCPFSVKLSDDQLWEVVREMIRD